MKKLSFDNSFFIDNDIYYVIIKNNYIFLEDLWKT